LSGFSVNTILDTQSVGCSTLAMIDFSDSWFNFFLSGSSFYTGVLRFMLTFGRIDGSIWILHLFPIFPSPVNT